MNEPVEIIKGLWTIDIELPANPLRNLNTYVVKAPEGGRNLIIDTGFYRPECLDALMHGIEVLDLKPENTDVFLTHLHPDHVGNAGYLAKLGYKMIMGALDYDLMLFGPDARWRDCMELLQSEGLPKDMFEKIRQNDESVVYTSGMFEAQKVYNGDMLHYGDFDFECILTPGHSPGHMCLYDKNSKTMLLGDHVLFDISPNICCWVCMHDSLGMYLYSLRKIKTYDVALPLPAHRTTGSVSLNDRIDELLAHHERRLNEAVGIIGREPGLNAYEIASRMNWRIKADSWALFPPSQQFFAQSETVAHLDRLFITGRVALERDKSGVNRYFLPK